MPCARAGSTRTREFPDLMALLPYWMTEAADLELDADRVADGQQDPRLVVADELDHPGLGGLIQSDRRLPRGPSRWSYVPTLPCSAARPPTIRLEDLGHPCRSGAETR